MTKGCLQWFCAEWQRSRRVLLPDVDSFQALRASLSPNGEILPRTQWVQESDLAGWMCDVSEATEIGLLNPDGATLNPSRPESRISEMETMYASFSSPVPDAEMGAGGSQRASPSPLMWLRESTPSRLDMNKEKGARGLSVSSLLMSAASSGVAARFANLPSGVGTASTIGMPGGLAGAIARSPSPNGMKRPRSVASKDRTNAFGTTERIARSPSPSPSAAGECISLLPTKHVGMAQPQPIFIWNPNHPLTGLAEQLTKAEFVEEIRKRLKVPSLFKYAIAMPAEAVLSVAEAEQIWEALVVIQDPSGYATQLLMGRRLDATVEQFFALSALRQTMEHTSPTTKGFFSTIDLGGSNSIAKEELNHFLKSLIASGEARMPVGMQLDTARIAEILLYILDVDRSKSVEFWELRRQLSIAAPPGVPLLEVAMHLELKYGFGKTGSSEVLTCTRLFQRFCQQESLDCSPEDVARYFGIWKGPAQALPPATWDSALKSLPCELSWDVGAEATDRLYCAIGVRTLQRERAKKRDACLPPEAVIEGVDSVDQLPSEAELRTRFERLWSRCIPSDGQWTSAAGLVEDIKEGCWENYRSASIASVGIGGLLQETGGSSGSNTTSQKEGAGSGGGEGGGGGMVSSPTTTLPTAQLPTYPRIGPRSLFGNIGDVLAVSSTRFYAGQNVIIRYRLGGAQNFISPEHGVLQDGRDLMPWPIPHESLGETPFIGLVPRGLRWTGAGGGGFYLGKEPFSSVDPSLRVFIPRDPHSGRLLTFGCVDLTPPLMKITEGMTAVDIKSFFELRLFCSRKNKIIGCVGDPLYVTVEPRIHPPPVESLQVRLEGRRATLRWSSMNLGSSTADAEVKEVRLYMRTGKSERFVSLSPGTSEWEVDDLTHDTEYDFRVRYHGITGWGREAALTCRTNNRCSEPRNVSRPAAGTTYAEISWEAPEILGNENTRDKLQANAEAIVRYEASLHVEDQDGGTIPQSDPADEAGGGGEMQGRKLVFPSNTLRNGPGRSLMVNLSGLRPDIRYSLRGLCAINSMGTGVPAKPLTFFTLPQVPKLLDCRVKQQKVIISFILQNATRMEYEITAALTNKPKDVRTLPVGMSSKKPVAEGQVSEAHCPFLQMASADADGSHSIRMRARNAGGWSEWSDVLVTISIARQQCADQVQAKLVEAIGLREIDILEQVTAEAQGIEFTDETPLRNAESLLANLVQAKEELEGAQKLRDPRHLDLALQRAREVGLPRLEESEELFEYITRVKNQLDEAKGIEALKAALSEAYEARLPTEHIQEAVDRLGTREAAHHNLQLAMIASRCPGLIAAIEATEGMYLPIEEEARRHLDALAHSELLLNASLATGLIVDLTAALESAAESGLREDELIATVKKLKQELEDERERAGTELKASIEARFPKRLRKAIAWSESAQVDEDLVESGRQLASFLEGLLDRAYGAVGVADRTEHLNLAREGDVPYPLIEAAEVQLKCLIEVIESHGQGDVPVTRRRLKAATVAGVKDVELDHMRRDFVQWDSRMRDLELAVALARTEEVRMAISHAEDVKIQPQQLLWAKQVLRALELRDRASGRLQEAVVARNIEGLRKALKHAADTNLQDRALILQASAELHHLQQSRLGIQEALADHELRKLFLAIEAALVEPVLTEEDLEEPRRVLAELQEQELAEWERHFHQAELDGDFRAMDALVIRGHTLQLSRVPLTDEMIAKAAELSLVYQEEDRLHFESEVHTTRIFGNESGGAAEFKTIKGVESQFKLPVEHDFAEVPYAVITGDVLLKHQAYGVPLCCLPREIIHTRLSVVGIETKNPMTNEIEVDLETAFDTAERLIRNLRAMLEPDDSIRKMEELHVASDGANQRVECKLAIYLRAHHTAHDVVQAIFEGRHLWRKDLSQPLASEYIAASKSRAQEEQRKKLERKRTTNLKNTVNRALLKMKMVLGPEAESADKHDNDELPEKAMDARVDSMANVLGETLSRVLTDGALAQIETETDDEAGPQPFVDHALGVILDPTPRDGSLFNIRPRVLRALTLDFTWNYPAGMLDNLDLSCLVYDDDKLIDILTHDGKQTMSASYYRRVETAVIPGELNGIVKHLGDISSKRSRQGKKRVVLRMDLIPTRVKDMVFVVSVHDSSDLQKFQDIKVTISDSEADAEFTNFIIGNGGKSEAIVVCAVSLLSDGCWSAFGIAESCKGTTRDFNPILERALSLGLPRNVSMKNQEPVLLESLQKTLDLSRPVKSTEVTLGPTNQMKLSYALELVTGEVEPWDAANLVKTLTKQVVVTQLVAAIETSGAGRFQARHVEVLPAKARKLSRIAAEMRFRCPDPEDLDGEERDCRFLDIAALCFSGRALQEVVDYRGAHGVRLVHNGVFDESGVWLGKVGAGDATDGRIIFKDQSFDDVSRTGQQSLLLTLPKMPPSTTDIILVSTSPVIQDIGFFPEVEVIIRDSENMGHEIETITMPDTSTVAEAAVLCRISRTRGPTWQIGAFRSVCNGSSVDYRPLIAHLRNIQERKHGRKAPIWTHRAARLVDPPPPPPAKPPPLTQWRETVLANRSVIAGMAKRLKGLQT